MPVGFDICAKEGGRMRTVTGKKFGLKAGEYLHVCFDKKGQMHRGYPKKEEKGRKSMTEK